MKRAFALYSVSTIFLLRCFCLIYSIHERYITARRALYMHRVCCGTPLHIYKL
jgi:hypothetical protein